jgi:hypothetical protein
MSAIKTLLPENQDDFVTDDLYEDFLQIQKDNSEKQALELINQHEATVSNRQLSARKNDFFKQTDDLPF